MKDYQVLLPPKKTAPFAMLSSECKNNSWLLFSTVKNCFLPLSLISSNKYELFMDSFDNIKTKII